MSFVLQTLRWLGSSHDSFWGEELPLDFLLSLSLEQELNGPLPGTDWSLLTWSETLGSAAAPGGWGETHPLQLQRKRTTTWIHKGPSQHQTFRQLKVTRIQKAQVRRPGSLYNQWEEGGA